MGFEMPSSASAENKKSKGLEARGRKIMNALAFGAAMAFSGEQAMAQQAPLEGQKVERKAERERQVTHVGFVSDPHYGNFTIEFIYIYPPKGDEANFKGEDREVRINGEKRTILRDLSIRDGSASLTIAAKGRADLKEKIYFPPNYGQGRNISPSYTINDPVTGKEVQLVMKSGR